MPAIEDPIEKAWNNLADACSTLQTALRKSEPARWRGQVAGAATKVLSVLNWAAGLVPDIAGCQSIISAVVDLGNSICAAHHDTKACRELGADVCDLVADLCSKKALKSGLVSSERLLSALEAALSYVRQFGKRNRALKVLARITKASDPAEDIRQIQQQLRDAIGTTALSASLVNLDDRVVQASICAKIYSLGGFEEVADNPVRLREVIAEFLEVSNPSTALILELLAEVRGRGIHKALQNEELQLLWLKCDCQAFQELEVDTFCSLVNTNLHNVVAGIPDGFEVGQASLTRWIDTNNDGKISVSELNRVIKRGDSLLARLQALARDPSNASGCLLGGGEDPHKDPWTCLNSNRRAKAQEIAAWLGDKAHKAGTVAAPSGHGSSTVAQAAAFGWQAGAARRQAYVVDASEPSEAARIIPSILADCKEDFSVMQVEVQTVLLLDNAHHTVLLDNLVGGKDLRDAVKGILARPSSHVLVATNSGARAYPGLRDDETEVFSVPDVDRTEMVSLLNPTNRIKFRSHGEEGWLYHLRNIPKLARAVGRVMPHKVKVTEYGDVEGWFAKLGPDIRSQAEALLDQRARDAAERFMLRQLGLFVCNFTEAEAYQVVVDLKGRQNLLLQEWQDKGLIWQMEDDDSDATFFYIPQVLRLGLLTAPLPKEVKPSTWTAAQERFALHWLSELERREQPISDNTLHNLLRVLRWLSHMEDEVTGLSPSLVRSLSLDATAHWVADGTSLPAAEQAAADEAAAQLAAAAREAAAAFLDGFQPAAVAQRSRSGKLREQSRPRRQLSPPDQRQKQQQPAAADSQPATGTPQRSRSGKAAHGGLGSRVLPQLHPPATLDYLRQGPRWPGGWPSQQLFTEIVEALHAAREKLAGRITIAAHGQLLVAAVQRCRERCRLFGGMSGLAGKLAEVEAALPSYNTCSTSSSNAH